MNSLTPQENLYQILPPNNSEQTHLASVIPLPLWIAFALCFYRWFYSAFLTAFLMPWSQFVTEYSVQAAATSGTSKALLIARFLGGFFVPARCRR